MKAFQYNITDSGLDGFFDAVETSPVAGRPVEVQRVDDFISYLREHSGTFASEYGNNLLIDEFVESCNEALLKVGSPFALLVEADKLSVFENRRLLFLIKDLSSQDDATIYLPFSGDNQSTAPYSNWKESPVYGLYHSAGYETVSRALKFLSNNSVQVQKLVEFLLKASPTFNRNYLGSYVTWAEFLESAAELNAFTHAEATKGGIYSRPFYSSISQRGLLEIHSPEMFGPLLAFELSSSREVVIHMNINHHTKAPFEVKGAQVIDVILSNL